MLIIVSLEISGIEIKYSYFTTLAEVSSPYRMKVDETLVYSARYQLGTTFVFTCPEEEAQKYVDALSNPAGYVLQCGIGRTFYDTTTNVLIGKSVDENYNAAYQYDIFYLIQ